MSTNPLKQLTDSRRNKSNKPGRKCLFLDRDGIINHDHGYVSQAEDFQFIDGIFELCRAATNKGYLLIVVTNQSGIARGYYRQQQFHCLTRWMCREFWHRGIRIQQVLHCPHHPHATGHFGFSCSCRKPKPGMIFKARRQWGIDLSQSALIGDSPRDIEAARKAGIPESKRLLLKSGENLARTNGYTTVNNLRQAINFL